MTSASWDPFRTAGGTPRNRGNFKWGDIEQMPATIELLKVAPSTMEFYEPHEFERLVEAAAKVDHQHLVFILLGGEAGLRCG
ncbi:hypothetical protein [Myxococcus sp. AB056]|uniref:hypothetical protein n=1 Tax=Myxococcus sp. AB056 TaxID=2562792 RepID=UPI001E346D35|nr:hypothetical protein [Myxococcus sp. AB056]